jgi:hypothetical protein
MHRWLPTDHRYNLPPGRTGYTGRPAVKWIGLLVAWVIITAILSVTHLGVLLLVIMAGLICYVVYSILRDTPRAERRTAGLATAGQAPGRRVRQQFNAPPGWPELPPGWEPPAGWQPDPSWPSAPPGWEFWVWPSREPKGSRTGRYRRASGSHRDGA